MIKYSGLGKEDMDFDEAMDLLKESITELDPYVMDILFDITMNSNKGEDQQFEQSIIYNRS